MRLSNLLSSSPSTLIKLSKIHQLTVFIRNPFSLAYFPSSSNPPLSHPRPTPHTLQQPISLRQTIQRIIPLAHRPHETTQRINLVLTRVPAVLVYFADGNLHGGMVFGFDDAVCCGAFTGNVAREDG